MSSEKLKSLYQLMAYGVNTPTLVVRPVDLDQWNRFHTAHTHLSIRTTRLNEKRTPHFPNIPLAECDLVIPRLLREGYEVLVFEPIDPRDCLKRGTMAAPSKDGRYWVEWIEGPGTVRDIETSDKINSLSYSFNSPDLFPLDLQPVVEQVVKYMVPGILDNIVEWSIYKNPVGKLKQNVIFWEIRPWQ